MSDSLVVTASYCSVAVCSRAAIQDLIQMKFQSFHSFKVSKLSAGYPFLSALPPIETLKSGER